MKDEIPDAAVEAAKKVLFDRKLIDVFSVRAAIAAASAVMHKAAALDAPKAGEYGALVERLEAGTPTRDTGTGIGWESDTEAADALMKEAKAAIASLSAEVERLTQERDTGALLYAVTEIRARTGVGGKPMLSELPDAIMAKIGRLETALHEIAGSALSGSHFEEIALDALGFKTEAERLSALASEIKEATNG